jgi:hypothetical protein
MKGGDDFVRTEVVPGFPPIPGTSRSIWLREKTSSSPWVYRSQMRLGSTPGLGPAEGVLTHEGHICFRRSSVRLLVRFSAMGRKFIFRAGRACGASRPRKYLRVEAADGSLLFGQTFSLTLTHSTPFNAGVDSFVRLTSPAPKCP